MGDRRLCMKEVHVVGAAILKGCAVLAAKRSMAMQPPLKWEFAGGKVEAGESHGEALKREILEELGIRISVGSFLADGMEEDEDRRILLHVYEACIIEGEPVPREHSQLKWIEIDRLGELDWANADIPACKELMKRYGGFCWGYGIP